ncbi:MAG: CoB--CoM heterodisulfide reductase iron-sulfur subunit A family protein [Desulfobacteraceae bacterium]|nr:CoB--CoM heterodisulfide reductase iron-sulfur subunit A family protein [Desulfobacteraceae bacterium]
MMGNSESKTVTGAVMVVGGGIAGTQAALDAAEQGFYVYLVEKAPSIGGMMAQLDKTFPTNDCSMCILSPKLVESGRHLNIELLTMSEVDRIEGDAGNFSVTVRERPRYVDFEKCIACGICSEKCPRKVDDEFNMGLNKRKAAYVMYPQAVPLKYLIDGENCIYFQKGKCKACEKYCPAGAVDLGQKEKTHTINVGAIILAAGSKVFDPSVLDTYGYGGHPNIVTSLEFERILSASGPFEGHLVRPSDRKECKRIAWLQCVGSRDTHEGSHTYCSGVCCTYAIKEAVIAREHAKDSLDAAIFYMDMRTYGKDFERYYNRAKNEMGVRFIRSRVHSVGPERLGSPDLRIDYVDEKGSVLSETFDLVVLSQGLEAPADIAEMAKRLQIDLDASKFVQTSSLAPVETSRPGIFVCGFVAGPKDIPSSVIDASAASGACAALLSPARGTLTNEKTYPPEDPVVNDAPKVGVFVCHCGLNIASVVDVPAVREYARNLPGVAYVADNLFTCSQDTQKLIREAIKEHGLNRVVVAACTPRTHEPLFQETIREAGINRYLFEMANIRDQDSWVHQNEPEKATQKAKDLLRMAVAKVALLEPLERMRAELNQGALIVGGGVSGMTAALNLAEQGFKTYLLESAGELGGNALKLKHTWKGESVPEFLGGLRERVMSHPLIEVQLHAGIKSIQGFVGQFITTAEVAGVPRQFEHGVVIIASGAEAYKPKEYLYGKSDRVVLWHELEELFEKDPRKLEEAKSVVFIQCVGSREPDRPYCSKICCTASVKEAIELKERKPDLQIYVLYRDLRTYGLREELYTKARSLGIMFIRFPVDEKPVVETVRENGKELLSITVRDHVLDRPVRITADYLKLATAIVPKGEKELAGFLNIPLNQDGFFLEAHMKLRPVEFAVDGIFLCGLAHYPKPLDESIAQAKAAAAKAAGVLSRPYIEVEPVVSSVNKDDCTGCGLCEKACPFGAIRRHEIAGKGLRAESIAASCKGCGVCAAACPQKAIDIVHFRDTQIVAAIRAGGESA